MFCFLVHKCKNFQWEGAVRVSRQVSQLLFPEIVVSHIFLVSRQSHTNKSEVQGSETKCTEIRKSYVYPFSFSHCYHWPVPSRLLWEKQYTRREMMGRRAFPIIIIFWKWWRHTNGSRLLRAKACFLIDIFRGLNDFIFNFSFAKQLHSDICQNRKGRRCFWPKICPFFVLAMTSFNEDKHTEQVTGPVKKTSTDTVYLGTGSQSQGSSIY